MLCLMKSKECIHSWMLLTSPLEQVKEVLWKCMYEQAPACEYVPLSIAQTLIDVCGLGLQLLIGYQDPCTSAVAPDSASAYASMSCTSLQILCKF